MDNISTVKIELGIDARRVMQQIAIDNQVIEEQISKGIENALNELSNRDKLVEIISQQTKEEVVRVIRNTVLSWKLKTRIEEIVFSKMNKKIEKHIDGVINKFEKFLEED